MESWICVTWVKTDAGEASQLNRFDTEEEAIAYGEAHSNSKEEGEISRGYEIYEDCHSPYMGILDEEETATEETETEADVEETTEEIQQDPPQQVKTSPKTGDPGAIGWILLATITGLALLGILWRKK